MKKIILIFWIVFSLKTFCFPQSIDSLSLTPPMGWNSWNKFGCSVSEKLIKEVADALVSSGMKNAGYQYIVIDDC